MLQSGAGTGLPISTPLPSYRTRVSVMCELLRTGSIGASPTMAWQPTTAVLVPGSSPDSRAPTPASRLRPQHSKPCHLHECGRCGSPHTSFTLCMNEYAALGSGLMSLAAQHFLSLPRSLLCSVQSINFLSNNTEIRIDKADELPVHSSLPKWGRKMEKSEK